MSPTFIFASLAEQAQATGLAKGHQASAVDPMPIAPSRADTIFQASGVGVPGGATRDELDALLAPLSGAPRSRIIFILVVADVTDAVELTSLGL